MEGAIYRHRWRLGTIGRARRNAPILDGAAVQARRRQRARFAPSSSRRRMAACTGEWMATRWPLVAWAALDGAVQRCASLAAAKGAVAVAHGVAHLHQLVADARKLPGDRAAQG